MYVFLIVCDAKTIRRSTDDLLFFAICLFVFMSLIKGPDPECDKKCANRGMCNLDKICQCPEGYMGQYCETALCYPQCMNGGNCTAPAVCSCPHGFQGRHCEGGEYQFCIMILRCKTQIKKYAALCQKKFSIMRRQN